MAEDYMSWIAGLREDLQAAELRIASLEERLAQFEQLEQENADRIRALEPAEKQL